VSALDLESKAFLQRRFIGEAQLEKPRPEATVFEFAIPQEALNRGYNVIEICPKRNSRVVWVEIAMKA